MTTELSGISRLGKRAIMDATTYAKLKAAGIAVDLAMQTKIDPVDNKKTVKNAGFVEVTAPVFDSATGEQTGTTTYVVQIASKEAERAALAKQLADLDAQIADLKGAA